MVPIGKKPTFGDLKLDDEKSSGNIPWNLTPGGVKPPSPIQKKCFIGLRSGRRVRYLCLRHFRPFLLYQSKKELMGGYNAARGLISRVIAKAPCSYQTWTQNTQLVFFNSCFLLQLKREKNVATFLHRNNLNWIKTEVSTAFPFLKFSISKFF